MNNQRIKWLWLHYYLGPFILSQAIILFSLLGAWLKGSMAIKGIDIFYFWLATTLFIQVTIGGIYHYVGEHWGPKRVKKLLQHDNIKRFSIYGFKYRDLIPGYEAVYEGFHVAISMEATAEAPEAVLVGCLVSIKEDEFDAVHDYADTKGFGISGAGDCAAWIIDRVEKKPFREMPSFEEIKFKLDNLIRELKCQQLCPEAPRLLPD